MTIPCLFQQLAAAAIKANMLAAKAVLAEAASGGDEPPAIPCVPKIEGAAPAMPGIAPSIIPETPKAAKATKTPKKAPKSKSKEGAGPSEPKEPPVIPLELREWEETPRTPFKPEIKRKTKKQLAIEAAEAAIGGGCFKRRNSSSTCLPSSVGRRAAA